MASYLRPIRVGKQIIPLLNWRKLWYVKILLTRFLRWFVTLTALALFYIALNSIPYRNQMPPLDASTPSFQNLPTAYKFPKIIHQMWKEQNLKLSSDHARWQQGCQQVNSDYVFKFYYDSDLIDFVTKEYQQYLPLFKSLHGIPVASISNCNMSTSLWHLTLRYSHGGYGACTDHLSLRRHIYGHRFFLSPSFHMSR